MRQKLISLLLALSVIPLIGCNKKTEQEYIESARVSYINHDINSAILALKNAIIIEPSNFNTRVKIGHFYFEKSLYEEAEKELRKALELGAPADLVIPPLSRTIFYQNDFFRVINLTKDFKTDDKAILSSVNLFNYLSKFKTEENVEQIEIGYLENDDQLIARAYQSLAIGNLKQSEEIINTFQNQDKNKLEKLLLSSLVNTFLDNKPEAIEDLENAVAIAPNYYVARFQLAEILIKADRQNEAKSHVNFLYDINSKSAYINLLKAQIEFKNEKFEDSFSSVETAIQNGIDNTVSNLLAGVTAYRTNKLESAYRYLSKVAPSLPNNHLGKRLLAEVQLRLGYTDNIETLMSNFSGDSKYESELYSKAGIRMFQQGNLEKAKSFLSKSNSITPNNSENLLKEGLVRLLNDDFEGIKNLEHAIKSNEELDEAWMLLAQAHVQAGDIDLALETAQKWQKIDSENGTALEAYIYLQINKNTEARKLLENNLKQNSEHPISTRFLMLLNARENRLPEARELAERLVYMDLSNLQSMITLTNIVVDQKQVEQLEPFFTKIITDNADDNDITMTTKAALALLYNYQKQPEKAISLLSNIVEPSKEIFAALGNTYFAQKQFNKAFDTYSQWKERYPSDKRAWLYALEALNESGDYNKALIMANEATNLFPHEQGFDIFIASFLLKTGKVRESREKLDELKKQNINNPLLKLFDGELALLQQDFSTAALLLKEHYNSTPSFETAKLLADSLAGLGKAAEGAKYLEQELIKLPARFKEIHYVAEFYSTHSMYEKSAEHYESIITRFPDHLITLNNYADVLVKLSRVDEAYKYAAKVNKLAPDSPYFMDTLGWIIYKQKKPREALYYLSKAYEKLPDQAVIQLHYAEVLIAEKQYSEAKGILRRVKATNISQEQELKRLNSAL
ncbi:XrtA/PEP-CTERM system TPR-repeat protein PrsT [Paraglaciecola sp. L3A3]|uniref:XrtA/PEP-CTERM system TPR-repeat protein PrsT n=1 Tax=Paraglaciecola sp. L3A3 TaxID=2686358 RepID=UPI00131C9BB5|nr:XrtA/PEP-CTERM system TPR-repeat protein PrsT [Paraglaciecola sp. L3A3]